MDLGGAISRQSSAGRPSASILASRSPRSSSLSSLSSPIVVAVAVARREKEKRAVVIRRYCRPTDDDDDDNNKNQHTHTHRYNGRARNALMASEAIETQKRGPFSAIAGRIDAIQETGTLPRVKTTATITHTHTHFA